MTGRDFTERDIHLALDGELPADERTGYEAWLDSNPDMKARNARYAADMEMLRHSLAGIIDEPVPERLRQVIAGEAPSRVSPARHWRSAAAAAIFLLGGIGGYLLGVSGWHPAGNASTLFADNAIAAHNIYSAEKLHVVEVGADQKDHLLGWLSKRVGLPLVAPDLSSQGFELVGGRLLPEEGRTAAQFMYQDHAGNRVSLYVTRDPSKADTGFRLIEEGATRALYWADDGYGCAVAGTMPEQALAAIANASYRQLLEGMKS